jgi:hypothetical protein
MPMQLRTRTLTRARTQPRAKVYYPVSMSTVSHLSQQVIARLEAFFADTDRRWGTKLVFFRGGGNRGSG